MDSMILLLFFSILHSLFCGTQDDKCIPLYGKTGEYSCKLSISADVTTTLTCEVVGGHTCTATKTHYVKPTPEGVSTATGTFYYTLQVTLVQYTKSAHITIKSTVSSTVQYVDSFNLEYFHPYTERTRIDCHTSVRPDYHTTKYTCDAYISDQNFHLSQQGTSECTVKIPPVNAETSKLLTKKSYTVTVTDSEGKCNRNCQVTLVIPDLDSSNNQISQIIKHKTTCPGPIIYCDSHDTEKREIECQFQVSYPFDHIEFATSDSSLVTLAPDSVAPASLTSGSLTKVTIKYTIKKFPTSPPEFKIEFKVIQVTGETAIHIISQKIVYVIHKDETKFIECVPYSQSSTKAIGALVYSCNIIASSKTPELEIVGSAFLIDQKNPSLRDHLDVFKIEKHHITITPNEVKCSESKEVTIKIEIDNIKTKVQHTTTCPEPIFNCNKHNIESRTITCGITIAYNFKEINIKSATNYVKIPNPTQIMKADVTLNSPNDKIIQYTVDDFSKPTTFNLEFEVLQTGSTNPVVKKVKTFKYKLKSNESPGVSCVEKVRSANQKFELTIYRCQIISLQSSVTLETEIPKFLLSSQTISGAASENGIYKKENHDLSISATEIICNNHGLLTIFFEENSKKYSTVLPHVTNCPAPVIEYTSHDSITRSISLKITIEYEFNSIEIRSITNAVQIEPINIEYVADQKIYNQNIPYILRDLSASSDQFTIKLDVYQKNSHLAYTSTKDFTFRFAKSEKQYISCSIKGPKDYPNFAAVDYECNIVSKNQVIEIKKTNDETEYIVKPETAIGRQNRNLYSFNKLIVTITPNAILCNKHKIVNIQIKDGEETFQTSVSHTTTCPIPIIDCANHNVESRKIICGIRIKYRFASIALTSSLGNKLTLIPTSIAYDSNMETTSVDQEISYDLKDYNNPDHAFDIEFTVSQANKDKPISVKKRFSYVLKPSEIPHLKCLPKEPKVNGEFEAIEYTCDVLSKSQISTYSIKPETYVVTPNPDKLTESNEVYSNTNLLLTIKPSSIVCSKVETVTVSFSDSGLTVKDMLKHETKCPIPTLSYGNTADGTRKISLTINSKYQFTEYTIESDTEKVIVTEDTPAKPSTTKPWKVDLTIKYAPHDWSSDSQKFKIISKIVLSSKQIIPVVSKEFTLDLNTDEKPSISCNKKEKVTNKFTLTYYTCTIISRLSKIKVESETNLYEIMEQDGKALEQNNVYKWNNYEILLRDDKIECNKDVTVKLFFKDPKPVSTDITVTTRCHDPVINCDMHDKVNRTIECRIVSEYPYSKVEFSIVEPKNVEIVSPKSENQDKMKVMASSHIIVYKVKKLKSREFHFQLKYVIKQGSDEITSKQMKIDYELSEKEYPQVSCEPYSEEGIKDKKITVSTYLCYIVSEISTSTLSMDHKDYIIVTNMSTSTSFEDLYKWEYVKVAVEDTKMYCNKTVNLTLSLKNAQTVLSSAVLQHTTYCHELFADCKIIDKDRNLILCNFSSSQSFTFHGYSCSEIVECQISTDLGQITGNSQEHYIEFNSHSHGSSVEFELNVTLSYSENSKMHYHYALESTSGDALQPTQNKRAASTGIISSSSAVILLITVGTFLAIQMFKKKKPITQD